MYPCEFKAWFMPETGSAIIGVGRAAGSARQRSGLIEEDALARWFSNSAQSARFVYFPV